MPHQRLAILVGLSVVAAAGCKASAPGLKQAVVSNPPVAISQVYGGGGNASAPYQNDFVELHNRTNGVFTLDGLSLQYASATGTGNFGVANQLALLSGNVPAGGYFLVKLGSGGAADVALPPADSTEITVNMAAGAGKIALVTGAAPLGCNGGSAPCNSAALARIVDLVGYGNANFREGAAVPTLGAMTAALRKTNGCTDTDDNLSDFDVGPPAPRNSATAPVICGGGGDAPPAVTSTDPPSAATGVSPAVAVRVTFSEPVTVAGNWFSFDCTITAGPIAATVSGGPITFTLTPPAPLAAGESCALVISQLGVHDVDSDDPPDLMAGDYHFGFTVASPVATIGVHDVQGASHLSPRAGQSVSVGPAVVTVLRSSGFYMEDLTPDSSDATSEGIFVFTSSAPTVQVGDVVVVTGTVSEFRPGCNNCAPSDSDYNNLTSTEMVGPSVTVQSHGHPLPAPVALGNGGGERPLPGQIIDDDAGGNVETSGTFDPATDGIDFLESLEGMRVRLEDPVVVGPTHLFSGGSKEIQVLIHGGTGAGLRTPRGGIIVGPTDFNPERLFLANTLLPSFPDLNVGDGFAGAVVGVLDYSFGNYKVVVSDPLPALAPGGITPEVTGLVGGSGQLTIGSINVENLDPTDAPSKFSRLAAIVVQNMGAPDLLAVEEVQDNNGATNDAVVDASVTLDTFVAAITAAGGPGYSYRQINPQDDQDGGEPGGNIRVAILFRTDRGLAFVDRGSAGSTTANAVDTSSGSPHLAFSPGRLSPTDSAFSSSRKPLAAELTYAGRTYFVIANHFNSKGGDQPLLGRFQPPVRASETQRQAQAAIVAGFVQTLLGAAPNAAVVVLGDLNDFSFSPAVTALKAAGLTDLIETLPAGERYSYVFEGNSQDLDHILVSAALASQAAYDVVHVNAEFADQASDHDPSVLRLQAGTAPIITSTAVTTVAAGGSYSYGVTASGVPAPTYALDQAPAGMTIGATSGLITWTASAPGAYPVTVRAHNGVSPDATQSFTVEVLSARPVPALSPAGAAGMLGLILVAAVLRMRRRGQPL